MAPPLNQLAGALRQARDVLSARLALVGGLAVSVRTQPRFTRDVDLALAIPSDAEAEALVHRLTGQGYAILALVEQEEARRLATVRLATPERDGIVVDLLFASSGIEPEIVGAAQRLQVWEGVDVEVATVAHLLATKVLACSARRPQDAADIRSLLDVARPPDVEEARRALALISARGYARGKDLLAELAGHLS